MLDAVDPYQNLIEMPVPKRIRPPVNASLADVRSQHWLKPDCSDNALIMSKPPGLFPPKRQRRPDRVPYNTMTSRKIVWRHLQQDGTYQIDAWRLACFDASAGVGAQAADRDGTVWRSVKDLDEGASARDALEIQPDGNRRAAGCQVGVIFGDQFMG